jgi:hypothetical protein
MCDRAAISIDSAAGEGVQTLVLEIEPADLGRIRAAQLRIILARSTGSAAPAVVWHSLEPFEINTVTWRDGTYGLYAATVALVPGAQVVMVALLADAQSGYYYAFTSSAVFEGPYWDPTVGRGDHAINNAMPHSLYPQLTFGLAQDATINGTVTREKPATASSVMAGRQIILGPVPVMYVWLDSGIAGSTVIARVGDDAVTVDYSSITTKTLIYDPDLGRFVPKQGAGF